MLPGHKLPKTHFRLTWLNYYPHFDQFYPLIAKGEAMPTFILTRRGPDATELSKSAFITYNIRWAASSEFRTYHLCEQRRFRRSLRIRAVSPEPPLLAHTSSESRGTFRQKAKSLAPLKGWAYAVKIWHDGMREDTNSHDEPQIM